MGAVSAVGDAVGHAFSSVVDTGSHALNAVGTDINNGVNRVVPGGWGTVAAVTAAAMGMPEVGLAGEGAAGAAAADAAATGAIATPVYSPSVIGSALPALEAAAPAAAAAAAPGVFSTPVYGASGLGAGTAASGADAMLAGLSGEYAGGLGQTGALTGGVSDVAGLGAGEYAGGLGMTGGLTGGITDAAALGGEYASPEVQKMMGDYGLGSGSAASGSFGTALSNFLKGNIGGTNLTGAGALTGAAGIAGLLALLKSEDSKYGVPGRQAYSGPLSQFKYSPSTFQPTKADPNMFRPRPGSVTTVADQQAMPQMGQQMPFMGQQMPQMQQQMPFMGRGRRRMSSPFMADSVSNPYAGMQDMYAAMGYAGGGSIPGGQDGHLGGYSDGGRLLRGPGDGVSDSIPATIGRKQPARLADGEFVVPARIVSELGNGSTEAGARQLYAMLDRVQNRRKKTVGKGKVAVNSKADKDLPA